MRSTATYLAVSIGLTMMTSMAFANVTLDGLEVVGTHDKLHVLLKSHQLIPARVVSQRPDEVVLELSNIDTRAPIATRFSGQSLVSHVSMQALDDNHMRIVLRGDAIPDADIAFKPTQAPSAEALFRYEQPGRGYTKPLALTPAHKKAVSQQAAKTTAKTAKPQTTKSQDAVPLDLLEAASAGKPKAYASAGKPKAYASAPKAKASQPVQPIIETLPPEATVDPIETVQQPAAHKPAVSQNTPHADPYEPLLSAINGDPASDAVAFPAKADNHNSLRDQDLQKAEQESKTAADGLNWLQTIAPSLLGGVFMAIGGGSILWFLRQHKRPANGSSHYRDADYDDDNDWYEAPPATPAVPRRVKRQASHPTAQYTGQRDDVLGLAGFNRQLAESKPALHRPAPVVNPRHGNPQGLRQYAQANTPQPSQQPLADAPRRQTDDRLNRKPSPTARQQATDRLASMVRDDYGITQDEVRRSAGVKQRRVDAFQPPKVDQALPARRPERDDNDHTRYKNASRNGVRESLAQLQSGKSGLPPNPDVLNFLKSVADYMDKQPPK
jgi:hypothetical protein